MTPEFSGVPCGFTLTEPCRCQNSQAIAKLINTLGRDRSISSAFNRNGFDKVDAQIVRLLLVDPEAEYYTEAFQDKYPFSPQLKGALRNIIIEKLRFLMLYSQETDPQNIHCPILKEFIKDHGYNPEVYLQFMKDNPLKEKRNTTR